MTTGQSTVERILRLLELLQRKKDWTAGSLAEELSVTSRCIRRDIQRLRELGYPVHASSGIGGGYRLGSGSFLPPMTLDDGEAVATAIGLRLATGCAVEELAESAVSAMVKLDQFMPERARYRVAAIADAVDVVNSDAAVNLNVLIEIGHAVRNAERLQCNYCDRESRSSSRRVEPHRVVVVNRRWYLLAFDIDKDAWRTFRVDRFGAVARTGWRFTRRNDIPDPRDYVSHSVTQQFGESVSIPINAPAAQVRQWMPASAAIVSEVSEDSCQLTMKGRQATNVVAHLTLMPFDIDISGDPRLVAAAAELQGKISMMTRLGTP